MPCLGLGLESFSRALITRLTLAHQTGCPASLWPLYVIGGHYVFAL